jgi:hypothetical protein
VNVQRVIWLPQVEDKLASKHNVGVNEVEDVLFDNPHVRFVEKGQRADENLYAVYGQTAAGRWLIVFFILKDNSVALIISARDMEPKERRLYAKH